MALEQDYEQDLADRSHDTGESDSNWIVSYADMMTLLMAFFAIMFSFSKFDQKKLDTLREYMAKQFQQEVKKPFESLDKTLLEIIEQKNLKDKVAVIRNGSEIALTFKGAAFFSEGSTDIRPESKDVLKKIIDIVVDKARGYPVHVEGHTDDIPISTSVYPSNWELSGARASLVVRMMEERGYRKDLLHPLGFADTAPVAPNKDAQGHDIPENQSKNRRIVIRIFKNQDQAVSALPPESPPTQPANP